MKMRFMAVCARAIKPAPFSVALLLSHSRVKRVLLPYICTYILLL